MNEPIKILVSGGEAETELKKSRFIARVSPVSSEEEAEEFINSIKKEYYDARHNCYAYVIGKDADKVKFSDDGEPAQTAGLPIYNVLKEQGVRNACIVVTRYFGGTLLGAGPLTRMYVEAATLGLKASKIGVMKYGAELKIESDYPEGEKIRRYLEKEGINILNTLYTDKVTFQIRTDFEKVLSFTDAIASLTAGKAKTEKISEGFFVDTAV